LLVLSLEFWIFAYWHDQSVRKLFWTRLLIHLFSISFWESCIRFKFFDVTFIMPFYDSNILGEIRIIKISKLLVLSRMYLSSRRENNILRFHLNLAISSNWRYLQKFWQTKRIQQYSHSSIEKYAHFLANKWNILYIRYHNIENIIFQSA
jgi:hypothetical protein